MRTLFQRRGIRLVLAIAVIIVGVSLEAPENIDAQGPTPGAWYEVTRTPAMSYGPHTLGKWAFITSHGYDCSRSPPIKEIYRPTTGANAYWWTPGYDDSAWSSTGYVVWNDTWPIWGFNPLPQIGDYVWNGTRPCCGTTYDFAYFTPDTSALHRRQFTLPSSPYVLGRGRLHVFSDNEAIFYINGNQVGDFNNIPASWFDVGGTNVLAVQVCNDCTPNNMMGIQYILEVYYLPPPTFDGTVTTNDTGSGVGGIPIEFSGEYELCSAPGTFATQSFGTVTTAANGSYSFALNPMPVCDPASDCCGWQNFDIAESLPWDTLYEPVSASAPSPGSVQSRTHIQYPWQGTGTFSNNNFTVEFIPISTTLSVDYPYLVLEGPNLPPPDGPLPAQVIRGTYTGPNPLSGRPVDVYVWDGRSWTTHTTYTDASGEYMIDAGLVGDPLFGTTILGSWQAYAEVTAIGRGIFATNDVFWWVSWFPVHVTE